MSEVSGLPNWFQRVLPNWALHLVQPSAKGSHRELDLDVVRGLAILLAMGWHLNGRATGFLPADLLLAPGRLFGWAGVDLFFVLSGFLVGRLIFLEYVRYSSFDYGRFFVRRAFKLWPTLYIFLIVMLFSGTPPNEFLWQIGLHVQNYFHTQIATHLWSLAVEEHFYLLVGVSFLALTKARRVSSKLIVSTLTAMLIAPLVLRIISVALGASVLELQTQTQFRLDALTFGVLLAFLFVYKPEFFDRLQSRRWLTGSLTIAGFAFATFFPKETVAGSTIGYTITGITSACLLLTLYRSGIERGLPLPARLVGFLGVYSYAIYIWHVPLSKAVERILHKLYLPIPAFGVIALQYLVTILGAYIATKLIEQPSLRLRDRLFRSRV